MAAALVDLVDALRISINPIGQAVDGATDDELAAALTNGFWYAKIKGFFPQYRLDADGENIINVSDPTIDLPREEQQIIVMMVALSELENRLSRLATVRKSKAGPVETEVQYAATLLRDILAGRRQELEQLRHELVSRVMSTQVAMIDMVLERQGGFLSGERSWVR